MKQLFKLSGGGSDFFKKESTEIFLIVLVFFIIKAFLVQYSYNSIAPRLISNIQDKSIQNFKELSFLEASMFLILANNLFTQ